MSTLELAGRLPQRLLNFSKSTIGHRIKFGSVFLTVLLIMIAAMLCFLYFFQVNMLAQKGLYLNELEARIAKISKENQELQSDIASIKSLKFTQDVADKNAQLDEISAVIRISDPYQKPAKHLAKN